MGPKYPVKRGGKRIPGVEAKQRGPRVSKLQTLDEGHYGSEWVDDVDSKEILIPDDQLQLTEEELNKDITCVLRAENPYVSSDAVQFDFKEREYKPIPHVSHTVILFSMRGCTVFEKKPDEKKPADKVETQQAETKTEEEVKEIEKEEGKDEETAGVKASESLEQLDTKRKNKFNFCDRGVQTVNNPMRDQTVQTDCPLHLPYKATASLWEITSYEVKEKLPGNLEEKALKKKQFTADSQIDEFSNIGSTSRILERMVNQNSFVDINIDFKYWEDPCDEFHEHGMGSLLPLWKFNYNPMKNMTVTSVSWNVQHADIFAASFGTHEFLRLRKGCVCVFTLKCPSFPERIFDSEVGVFSVHFHPEQAHLLAAGFADGSVAVYNLRSKKNTPAFSSINCKVTHNDAVSQVKWLKDNIDSQHNFCSISADGKVVNWCLVKGELVSNEIISLKRDDLFTEGLEGTHLHSTRGGTAVSFNPEFPKLFLVSTEEGYIHLCSTVYTSRYLTTYTSHNNIINNIEWNPYHPRVFLTCSADWVIKIWDYTSSEPVYIFDLFNEVKDATWAPFSSSVFGAVTRDNKVHVFDLMMNRQNPTCTYVLYKPNKKVKLTTISFNPKEPVLLVADDRGRIASFKLSPNLRSSLKEMKMLLQEDKKELFITGEKNKMEKILKLAENPDERERE